MEPRYYYTYVDEILDSPKVHTIKEFSQTFWRSLREPDANEKDEAGRCKTCIIHGRMTAKMFMEKKVRKVRFVTPWAKHDPKTKELIFEAKAGEEFDITLLHPASTMMLAFGHTNIIEEL